MFPTKPERGFQKALTTEARSLRASNYRMVLEIFIQKQTLPQRIWTHQHDHVSGLHLTAYSDNTDDKGEENDCDDSRSSYRCRLQNRQPVGNRPTKIARENPTIIIFRYEQIVFKPDSVRRQNKFCN